MTLAWVAAAWLAGIAAAALTGAVWPLAIALATATVALALLRRDRDVLLLAVLLPLVFAAGAGRADQAVEPLADDAVARHNGGVALRLRGVLRGDPSVRDTSQQFTVAVRSIQRRGEWLPASGAVLVRVGLLPSYESGEVVEIEGKVEAPASIGEFDYAGYLERRGIASVMQYPGVRVIGHEDDDFVRATVLRVRRALAGGLARALPEPQSSLAQGVLLGERSVLPADIRDDFNTTNTSHLVVVSGTNVVIVAACAAWLFGRFVGRRRALLLSTAVVVAYALLIGGAPPVLRATIMGLVLVFAQISGRRSSGVTSILLAAALMAGWQPSIVSDVSFQLSIAATAGILYLSGPLHHACVAATGWLLRRDEVPRWFGETVATPLSMTVAAFASTAPLLALYFGRLSVAGLGANMAVVPLFPLMLAASLVAALGGLVPDLHIILAAPAYYLLSYWIAVAAWFAALPGAAASVDAYATPYALATYAVLVAAAPYVRRWLLAVDGAHLAPSRPFAWRTGGRRLAYAVPLLLLAVSAGFIALPAQPARLQVTVLDVGQGDAILIETPSGTDIMVDGGPGRAVLRGLGDELAWHDRSIDLVVVTHPHADHATGLLDVFRRYDVRAVLAADRPGDAMLDRGWRSAVEREGARVVSASASTFDLGDGVRLEVLPIGVASAEANDGGIVLRLTWGDVSFLFAADIEAPGEAALVASGADLGATVLKVAHHGSATSSTRAFLDAVRPSVAAISVARENAFAHPAPAVVERLSRFADVYTTAEDGPIRFQTDGQRLWIGR